MRDLSNYETVKERKKRFYSDHENGRIIVELQNADIMDYALFKATVYKSVDDQEKGLAWSTGYALEIRDKELSVSKSGQQYASVNYTSWVENCEESAVGRALDNAGYSGNDKCSREEMQKADRHSVNKVDFDEIKKKLNSMEVADRAEYWEELKEQGFATDKQKEAVYNIILHHKKGE